MSARDDLIQDIANSLKSADYIGLPFGDFVALATRDVQKVIDEALHEAAEKIRNTPSPHDPDDYCARVDMGADWAADLIDPTVQS